MRLTLQNLADLNMKPVKKSEFQGTFFNPWLETILNPSHEIYRLAVEIDWKSLEKEFSQLFVEDTGAPAKPVRLVIGLLMLQHMYGISDEGVVYGWVENPYWQFFCGEKLMQWEFPLNPSSLSRWRKRIGKAGLNKVLKETINLALKTGTIHERSLQKVIADTTVMEKNITFPTDSKTQYKAIKKLVKMAKSHNLTLRQTYIHIGRKRLIKAGRYSHARQMKRANKERSKIKTYLGRVFREIQRLIEGNQFLQAIFSQIFEIVEKLLTQTKESKNKIYSLHEPHVDCISKGKLHKKYEFGCKTSFVITHKEGLALGAEALHGNPFDGHTLKEALKNAEAGSGVIIKQAFVDKGYKGHKIEDKNIMISGQKRGVTTWFKKQLKRRQAIEPHIGHMKSDGKLGRNFLKGKIGDHFNAILCAIGHNMRMILKKFRRPSLVPS